MRRHAILIGYSGWDINGTAPLQGVSKDLINYRNYLKSDNGGAWLDEEITILEDKSRTQIETKLLSIRSIAYDMVFSVFSGHGDYDDIDNYCRRLEISKNETILEKSLWGLAKRQILIFDSCSGLRSQECIFAGESKSRSLMEFSSADNPARRLYEIRCMQCPPQQLKLYAAKVGTFARDTSNGGKYSSELLKLMGNSSFEMDIVEAHDMAAKIIYNQTFDGFDENSAQKPEKDVPRVHNYLPGVIHVSKMF